MWTTVSDSAHDHEREALSWLRSRLPEREPYHVWTNFEFTTHNGQLYEVDALAVTDNGFHLIEIKSHPGEIAGDAGTWQWTTPEGKFRQFDNPRILANRKAKALKGLIESTRAFRNDRKSVPYLGECVFLSDPKLRSGLNVQGRHNIFGRDAVPSGELPPERASLGGIVDHLTSLDPDSSGRPRRRIQRQVVDKLVRAIDQIGIRERSSRREVGDYRLSGLLEDVEADTTTGVAYQDFLGKHRSLELERRLRVYPLELNATSEQRQAAQRAARREFELLRPLDHPGILQPFDYTEHERGPVLIFDYEPDEVSLAAFLANPVNRTLSVESRLAIIRQIAEAVAFANRRGVFHRSLGPSAVLVTAADDDESDPRVRVTNWHTGARVTDGSTSTLVTGTVHSHVEALASGDAELFRAPEFAQPKARPVALDVFSLGALALFILTGERPASSARQLRSTLSNVGYLDPSAVADGVEPVLADVVISATVADPAERLDSAEEFLTYLDLAEEDWGLDDAEGVHPLDARRGDTLADGRLEVVQRLGKGSTAVALLVKDTSRYDQLCVVKVAHDAEHNDRLLTEASALDGLQHAAIVPLLEEPFELSGYVAILIGYAGPRVDPSRPELKEARTLASRLSDGPVGVELAQRWGEDLLDSLRYLEDMGRAHRDIKPENLGVAPRGENDELHLVLFDFSLSGAPVEAIEAGTPGYLDPFLDRRGRWDPAADRYSATVTLFEMVTGTKPRYGDGTADPAMVAAQPTVDQTLFDSAVAPGLVSFFTRALQPDTADRFGAADEMYWAWHEAFRTADAPSTPSVNPDEDNVVLPEGITNVTPLAGLPLSRRAVSALERAEILTVEDLLALPLMQLHSLPGVGARTRGEIREALDLLEAELGKHTVDAGESQRPAEEETRATSQAADSQSLSPNDATAEQPSTGAAAEELSGTLLSLAESAVPTARRANQQTQAALARILVGLEPNRDPWASQSDLADWLGVTSGRISQLVSALRKRWLKEAAVTQLRDGVRADLGSLRVASVDQIAARLLLSNADIGSSPTATTLARGLVRLATLAEEELASPGWIVRRRQGAALLAAQSGEDGGSAAQGLADYAVLVASAVSELIDDHDVIGRRELLDQLHKIPLPAAATPLPDAHLADLAADLCDDAAVNSRLELYRTGLDPVAALRVARRAFVTSAQFSPSSIASKIAARFPEVAALPGRPELDRVLQDAGVELIWREADGVYVSPQHEPLATSTSAGSYSRYPTNIGTPIPAVEIDNAADFENRLGRSHNNGGVLVLVTEATELAKAESQLDRLVDVTASVDEWLVNQIETLTETGKPSWETLAAADGAGQNGAAWGRLRQVVDRALDQFTQQLLGTEGTVLLTNAGLLARYDRLDLVAKWRDALHSGGHALKALWLLIPSTAASDVPLLDGRAVPVISRNEWSQIPVDWLRNAHRTGQIGTGVTP